MTKRKAVAVIDEVLRTYAFGMVQRPPLLWDAAYDKASLRLLLDAMLAASGSGAPELVLNLANMVIERDAADQRLLEGEYVAITLRGGGAWAEDDLWARGEPRPDGFLGQTHEALVTAGASAAYSRRLEDGSSLTVLLARR